MKKVKNMLDAAFRQSIELICERVEMNPEQAHLLIQFVGRQIQVSVFGSKKAINIPLASMVGSKMVALRLTAKEIGNMFRSLKFISEDEETEHKEISDVSLVVYNSQSVKKPCIGIYVKDKPQKALVISEVMEALKIGTEQIN